jgi:DNA polymerase III, alpha subunit
LERFLNRERISLPDFDIDFCQDRREEVIEYVQEKYGKESVAQIITFGSLQSRAVLRDVGRVLGLPYGQVDRICKLVPNNPANPTTLNEAIEGDIRIREERDNDDDIASMLKIGLELEGLYRNASTHAAGLVIGDVPLQNTVPLYRDPRSDMPVTQFNMKWVEASGLVKFDFLGLKTLTVIDKAINLINQKKEINLDISKIPLDDKPTFTLLGTGNTIGIFQLESSGMQDVLRNMKPRIALKI